MIMAFLDVHESKQCRILEENEKEILYVKHCTEDRKKKSYLVYELIDPSVKVRAKQSSEILLGVSVESVKSLRLTAMKERCREIIDNYVKTR